MRRLLPLTAALAVLVLCATQASAELTLLSQWNIGYSGDRGVGVCHLADVNRVWITVPDIYLGLIVEHERTGGHGLWSSSATIDLGCDDPWGIDCDPATGRGWVVDPDDARVYQFARAADGGIDLVHSFNVGSVMEDWSCPAFTDSSRYSVEPIGNIPPVELEQAYYNRQEAPAMVAGVT